MDKPFLFPVPTDIDFMALMPILAVATTGILALIVEMLRPKQNNNNIVMVSLAGLVVAAVLTANQMLSPEADLLGQHMFRQDRFGLVLQLILIVACFLTIMFSEGYLRQKRVPFGEFYPLVLWSTAGGMVMVATQNLLVIFLGLELLSISLYVMAGLSRREQKSEESALKYLLLGAFASAFLLYGIALIYGATGSLDLETIKPVWISSTRGIPAQAQMQHLILIGLAFALVGVCFKSAFVPFHQWTPDVYQGAPTNVTAFMAAGSKIAAIGVLFRILDASSIFAKLWLPALIVIAILTMCVGNLMALVQKDVKRILAYSSIAHAGYILVAILAHFKAPGEAPFATVPYYLLSYTLMTIGAFAVASLAAKGGKEGTRLEDLHGLWRRSPFAAGALVVFVASLIGIPPTAGFVGKLLIFRDAWASDLKYLAIILAVNSIVSVSYYLAIARAAFVSDEEEPAETAPLNPMLAGTCLLCAAGVVAVGVLIAPLMEWMMF